MQKLVFVFSSRFGLYDVWALSLKGRESGRKVNSVWKSVESSSARGATGSEESHTVQINNYNFIGIYWFFFSSPLFLKSTFEWADAWRLRLSLSTNVNLGINSQRFHCFEQLTQLTQSLFLFPSPVAGQIKRHFLICWPLTSKEKVGRGVQGKKDLRVTWLGWVAFTSSKNIKGT